MACLSFVSCQLVDLLVNETHCFNETTTLMLSSEPHFRKTLCELEIIVDFLDFQREQ